MSQRFQKPLTRCLQTQHRDDQENDNYSIKETAGQSKKLPTTKTVHKISEVNFRIFCDIVANKDLFWNKCYREYYTKAVL